MEYFSLEIYSTVIKLTLIKIIVNEKNNHVQDREHCKNSRRRGDISYINISECLVSGDMITENLSVLRKSILGYHIQSSRSCGGLMPEWI